MQAIHPSPTFKSGFQGVEENEENLKIISKPTIPQPSLENVMKNIESDDREEEKCVNNSNSFSKSQTMVNQHGKQRFNIEHKSQNQVNQNISSDRITPENLNIEIKKKNLSTRLDVVLKTIFRAMKMYYKKQLVEVLRSQKLKIKTSPSDKIF